MIRVILFLLTIVSTITLGQETKKITQEHENPKYKEVFYVLKTDKITKQGNYQKLGYKDVLLINGYFHFGLKDSVWTEYNWGGKTKLSEGKYSKDNRIGIWEFYGFKGELEQKYDFSKNEIVFFQNDDKEKEYKVIKGADTIKTKLERPPLCIGGSSTVLQTIHSNIKYPQEAKENGTGGKVFIAFTIDTNGKTSNHRVIKSVGSGCDEEALRVVKLIPDNWVPALLGEQTVDVEYILPINFQMR